MRTSVGSSTLANICLHYALDLWVQQWRRRRALGDIIIVRYADDFVLGFQRAYDAKRLLGHLRERLAKFRLELHPDKTRLLRLHEPIVSQGKWLGAVLRGHYAYYGVPTNIEALDVLRTEVTHRWFKSLRRRSQRRRLNWARMGRLAQQWLPRPHIVHPWPQQRFAVRTRDKSPVR
jgi:hypothetical protein